MADTDKLQNTPREKDLTERLDFLHKVADLSPNILFVIDLQALRVVYVSKKIERIPGYNTEFVLSEGSKIFELIMHPEDYHRRMENLEKCRALKGDEECGVEVRLRAGENKWEWYRITEKIFEHNEAGEVSHVVGTAQNIHQQKTWEEELREEHRRLENAQRIGNIGSFERELPGNVMTCSEEFYNILGIPPRAKGLTVDEFYTFVHPEDLEPLINAVNITHSTGEPVDTITRIVRPDGSIKHIHRRAAITKDENDIAVRVYGTMQDITERKLAEKELRRSEERSRNLLKVLQNAPDSYLVLTPSFKIKLVSDAFLKGAGATREEITGKNIFDVFPDNPALDEATGVKNLKDSLQTVLRTKKPHRMPIQHYDIRDRNGEFVEKHWSSTNSPVINSEGEVEYIIHRALDITDVIKEKSRLKGLVSETEILKTSLEEIKLQANQLKENKALLQSIFDASPNSIILYKPLYNKKGNVEDFEFAMVNAFNHSSLNVPRNIIGKKITEVFQNVSNTNILENYKNTVRTGIPADFEVWYQGDGFKNWFHFRAVKINDLLLVTAEDITERKQAEETLQQMLNGAISAITILQSVRNDKGEIVDFLFKGANKAAESINSVPNDELIGKHLLDVFPGVEGASFETFVQVVETGQPLRAQRKYTYEPFDHWFDVSAVKNGDGIIMTFLDITDQKKAEQELIQLKEELTQKATDKYRKIINSMDEGFSLIEIIRDDKGAPVDYRFLEANPIFEAQTGLKDVLGKTVNELVPNLESFWIETYGNVASTGKSIRFEDYSEPMERWFDVNAFRINAPNEQHVAIIFKDITERKEAEERQTFLINLNNAIRPLEDPPKIQQTAMRILGTYLEVNRAYYTEMLPDGDTLAGRQGYVKDVEPITGIVKISDFSPELHERLLQGQTIVMEDFLKPYEDDQEAVQKIKASQVRALIGVPLVKNGLLVGVVSIQQKSPRQWTSQEIALVEEVSEQTWLAMEKAEAEKILRESEQRFRNLVEASALAVWETQPDGTVLKDSPSWREFTGQSYEEFSGTGWRNAVHEEDRAYAENEWKKAVSNKTKFDAEFRLLSASGVSRWISAKAIPIFNMEGEVTKWSGMNIDIHDRKQAEEALIRAKEEAEAASRAKEDFLSTMSHEIRTPLNAVIGLTNLLLDKNPREDQKEDLGSLSFSAKNLLALINDILDFSKLEAGKAELTITDFDLPGLLLNLKQAHQPLADDKETQLELHIDENIPARIAADQLKLSQVLHNLVSNAVKFTARGTVSISVNLQKREGETFWLKFDIKDTGIGISEEKLEHIFEKFTQAESSTVRQYGGTGLGLSITRLLLELMGSEIHLESTPGEGSSFSFSLPVKKAKLEVAAPVLPVQLENIKDLQDLKLLLVEDVELNRKIIIQFLKNWWHLKPDEAKNGKEAIEMVRQNNYDLILMDIRMPVMDGYEATREIRKLPGYQDTPILALTADKNQELVQADHQTKFSGLLTKPFEPLDLKKKILLHLPVSHDEVEENTHNPESLSSEDFTMEEPETSKELMRLVLVQLKEYREIFISGVKENDLQQLKDLQHKSKVLFELLKLDELTRKVDEALIFIEKGAENEEPNEVIEEGKKLFDRAIHKVREEVNEPVFEISRYTAIAGTNKEILQKLISNSLRSLELYKQEFTVAANDRNSESLSDLVHKNTTSMHYLQANRLSRKISEFRGLLETTTSAEENLQEKQKEVLHEFRLIIKGIQELVD